MTALQNASITAHKLNSQFNILLEATPYNRDEATGLFTNRKNKSQLTDRIDVLGCPVDRLTVAATLSLIEQFVADRTPRRHAFLHAAKIVGMRTDEELYETISSSDLINVDGMAVLWAAKFLGTPLPERVNGTNLMLDLIDLAAQKGYKVFLLGARPDVIEEARAVIENDYPELHIVGIHHGYFEAGQDDAVADLIRAAAPDLLFVGMGTPQKEFWMRDHVAGLGVPFMMGVGGSFDVVAGRVRRAPEWAQNIGLEWLWRLVQEPRRMWRRYLIGNPIFIGLVVHEKWSQTLNRIRD